MIIVLILILLLLVYLAFGIAPFFWTGIVSGNIFLWILDNAGILLIIAVCGGILYKVLAFLGDKVINILGLSDEKLVKGFQAKQVRRRKKGKSYYDNSGNRIPSKISREQKRIRDAMNATQKTRDGGSAIKKAPSRFEAKQMWRRERGKSYYDSMGNYISAKVSRERKRIRELGRS